MLETRRLILRRPTLADAGPLQALAGDPDVALVTLNIPHPYADGMAEAWLRDLEDKPEGRSAFAVIPREKDALVGIVSLVVEERFRHASLGYWIGKPHWGRGYCTEAVIELLRHAFADLDLHRVYATHLSRNPASGRVMQKAGLQHEGCQREHTCRDGRFDDLELYGLLRRDWTPPAQ